MEILRNRERMIVEVVCAAGHDEDDENIVYCDCPFFRLDDGERSCSAMKNPYDMAAMRDKSEVVESCPLTRYRATIKLKSVFLGVECAECAKEANPQWCPAQGPDGTYPPPGGFEQCFEPRRRLTIQELAERIDTEAAEAALDGLRSKIQSLGFAAPEVFIVHMADIAELMNALATALVMQEVEDRPPPTPDPGDGEPLSEE